ncbi:MAG: type I toxin-antitoxin system SymE family toxin [Tannerella sp.]|jgi:hypothetical protein|nr:type I toxin-antitoxin system SymE family toxin [Tannerella sp.]
MSNPENKTQKAKPARVIKKIITSRKDEVSTQIKTEEPKVRYLKLHPFIRESSSKGFPKSPSTVVPELRLCGNWLEEAGFLPCNYVSVTVMEELLIIRSSKEQESD